MIIIKLCYNNIIIIIIIILLYQLQITQINDIYIIVQYIHKIFKYSFHYYS